MTSLTFHDIGLRPTQIRAVERRARKQGKSPSEYIRALVERDLRIGDSFDDVLRPVRAGFEKAGVTEEELDGLVAQARKAVHARQSKRKARK
jgi:hypothetical protein